MHYIFLNFFVTLSYFVKVHIYVHVVKYKIMYIALDVTQIGSLGIFTDSEGFPRDTNKDSHVYDFHSCFSIMRVIVV